ncbi:MAG: T9SS type A sorting domain-containing protein [Melioribacteraceae bacterium]|nr:T9SS type A sorting domain-containing protein [Melioribacteraceae bacterium]
MKSILRSIVLVLSFSLFLQLQSFSQLGVLSLESPDIGAILPLDVGTEYTFEWQYNYIFTTEGADEIDPSSVQISFVPADGASLVGSPVVDGSKLTAVIKPNMPSFRILAEADDILDDFETPKSAANYISIPLTVPVEFASLRANAKNKTIELEWSTSVELNNDHFEIERSDDSRNFSKVADIRGAGFSESTLNYSFVDKNPVRGINYYRIKQVDFNGEFSYSETVSARYEDEGTISLAPNPISLDEETTLYIYHDGESANSVLSMFDISGKLISQQNLTIQKGQNALDIVNEELKSGTYLVQLRVGSKYYNKKLIVQ